MSKPTICCAMIVKDEQDVIRRCMDSVSPFVDAFVIFDTGSTDKTKELILNFAGKPIHFNEAPWVDFSTNRNQALREAKRLGYDFTFVIDADEIIVISDTYDAPDLEVGGYYMTVRYGGVDYARLCLLNNKLDWEYHGVLHEYLDAPVPQKKETLKGLTIHVFTDGARSKLGDVEKYSRDAKILMGVIDKCPKYLSHRYRFYLAQSYRDSSQYTKALYHYKLRASLGGFEEEAWYSLYQAGGMAAKMGDTKQALKLYQEAYERRPTRAEPLVAAAKLARDKGFNALGAMYAATAMCIVYPSKDMLFIERDAYGWVPADEAAINLYWSGNYKGARNLNRLLLYDSRLPPNQVERIKQNIQYCEDKLK